MISDFRFQISTFESRVFNLQSEIKNLKSILRGWIIAGAGARRPRDSRQDACAMLQFPVPMIFTFCGLVVALSVRIRFAGRDPVALGLKVTLIVHFAADARLVPQVLVCE